MQEGITRHDAGTPSNHWHQINALSGVKVLRVLRPENRPLGDTAFRTANAPQAISTPRGSRTTGYLSLGRKLLISQNSRSPPIDAMKTILSLSGDQPNSLRSASSGRPVRSSSGAPPPSGVSLD
jgi:hypothetical protein